MKEAKRENGSIRSWRRLLVCLLVALCLSGCGAPDGASAQESETAPSDEALPLLEFDGRRYRFSGEADAIRAEGACVTILRGGRYRVCGTLKEGTLTVDAPPSETVHLLLDNVSLSASSDTPLYLKGAACVILESTLGSVNVLSDAETANADAWDAVLRADVPLILRGKGSLILSAHRALALLGTGTVTVESGRLCASAPDTALWVRDRFLLQDGRVQITEATHGVAVGMLEGDGGRLEMSGGALTVQCREIALSATRTLSLTGGVGSLRAKRLYACFFERDGKRTEGVLTVSEGWLSDA